MTVCHRYNYSNDCSHPTQAAERGAMRLKTMSESKGFSLKGIEVLHRSENVTSRIGNAPSCRATTKEKCTETVVRMTLAKCGLL